MSNDKLPPLSTEFLQSVRTRALASGRNMFSPEEYVRIVDEVLEHRSARKQAVDDAWRSRPTPSEAAANLRAHAFKNRLPPGDNNFEDAARIIDALALLASLNRSDAAVDRAVARAKQLDPGSTISDWTAIRELLDAAFVDSEVRA